MEKERERKEEEYGEDEAERDPEIRERMKWYERLCWEREEKISQPDLSNNQ